MLTSPLAKGHAQPPFYDGCKLLGGQSIQMKMLYKVMHDNVKENIKFHNLQYQLSHLADCKGPEERQEQINSA